MFLKLSSRLNIFAQAIAIASLVIPPAYAVEFDVGISSNAVFQGIELNDSTSVSLKASQKINENVTVIASGKSIDYGGEDFLLSLSVNYEKSGYYGGLKAQSGIKKDTIVASSGFSFSDVGADSFNVKFGVERDIKNEYTYLTSNLSYSALENNLLILSGTASRNLTSDVNDYTLSASSELFKDVVISASYNDSTFEPSSVTVGLNYKF